MPDMADMALADCAEFENMLDSYVSGNMSLHEAYELGIVDELGSEKVGVQAAWDRSPIGTLEEINNCIRLSELEFDLADARKQLANSNTPVKAKLNKKAIKNLSNTLPTCNKCNKFMSPQKGKYGKFYYCKNRCEGQGTVSDKYWQSVKK